MRRALELAAHARDAHAEVPVGAVLVLVDPLIPVPFALTAVILVVIVAVLVWRPPVAPADDHAHAATHA